MNRIGHHFQKVGENEDLVLLLSAMGLQSFSQGCRPRDG